MFIIYPEPVDDTPIRPQSFDEIETAVQFGNSTGTAFVMEAMKR